MRKIFLTVILFVFCALGFAAETVELVLSADKVEQYGVAEYSVKFSGTVKNPFWDAGLYSSWEAPSGKQLYAEGFFDGEGFYSLRFAALEQGTYKYKLTFKAGELEKTIEGSLESSAGTLPGFLRVSKENCFRFATDNGEAFYPLGIQTCNAHVG
ncbi:MAG: DUF5060 domain-containing protein, partial [Candidatus Firestonebacteria bacterium]